MLCGGRNVCLLWSFLNAWWTHSGHSKIIAEWMNEWVVPSLILLFWHLPTTCGSKRKLGLYNEVYSEPAHFPLVPLADRWCSTNRWPAPDTTFWKHGKQVSAQEAPCLQHPLPVPGSWPPTNVWCKYGICLLESSEFPFSCKLLLFTELKQNVYVVERHWSLLHR